MGMQHILRVTAQILQVDRMSLWIYEEDHHSSLLQCLCSYELETDSFSQEMEIKELDFHHYLYQLKEESFTILPNSNLLINQEWKDYLDFHRILSRLDIPIWFKDLFVGVLCCESTQENKEWTTENVQFAHFIGQNLAPFVFNMERLQKSFELDDSYFRKIVEHAIDAIVIVNHNGNIVFWNQGATHLFGFEAEEVMGKFLSSLIPQQGLVLIDNAVEVTAYNKKGETFPVQLSQSKWEKGGLEFETFIIRSNATKKGYEKKLLEAMRQARAANYSKTVFLSTMSHEFRTPLNIIMGFTACLLEGIDGPITDGQRESLKKVEQASFHLLQLVNDILDLAKIEASKMELMLEPTDLVVLIQSCLEEISALATQKNLEISFFSSFKSFVIYVDPLRLRQVLINLLSNAVKFTEQGKIEVSIEKNNRSIDICVKDTGIGLTVEEQQKLFQPFVQADNSISRKYGGTGLGLTISQKIVQMHGGMITVNSIKGQGSSFIVHLPIEEP
jgi:PAS domain S-box-containing protein